MHIVEDVIFFMDLSKTDDDIITYLLVGLNISYLIVYHLNFIAFALDPKTKFYHFLVSILTT